MRVYFMPTSTIDTLSQRKAVEFQRYDDYEVWKRMQDQDPELASVRMLYEDIRVHGYVRPETWQRFDDEEITYGAEVLDINQQRLDRFTFDGKDIIVKESDGYSPRITLREVYEKGPQDPNYGSYARAAKEPGLAFQARRDQYFLDAYEAIEQMMRDQTDYDTIYMTSTCPTAAELAEELLEMGLCPDEASALQKAQILIKQEHYNEADGKSYQYIFRKLPNGQLEMLSTRLDSSDLQAHDAVLQQSYGHHDMPFALMRSHERGRFLGFSNTTNRPIKAVAAEQVKIYDDVLQAKTGKPHRFGRTEEGIDAQEFFDNHCPEYWQAYKMYHEQLARHSNGQPLDAGFKHYLLQALTRQEAVGKSVLNDEQIRRLRAQLMAGQLTPEMILPCKKLMTYNHHATMDDLLGQYKASGEVVRLPLDQGGNDLATAYGDVASTVGSMAAAEGKSYEGCNVGNEVTDLSAAAQLAQTMNISLEQAMRLLEERQKKVADDASLEEKYGVENVRQGICGACGTKGKVGPCGPGFCNDCDTKDRKNPGYILRLYKQRQRQQDESESRIIVETPSISLQQQLPQIGEIIVHTNGKKHQLRERVIVGDTIRYWADYDTGEEIEKLY
jgi:hypothetical protein